MSLSTDEERNGRGKLQGSQLVEDKAQISHEEAASMVQLTPEEHVVSLRLRRKVDRLILPMAFIVYVMNYIDRNNYASARLQGLQEDLNMNDTEYQTGESKSSAPRPEVRRQYRK